MLVTKYDTHVLPEPRPRRRDGMVRRLRGGEQSSDASGSPDAVTVSGRAAHWLFCGNTFSSQSMEIVYVQIRRNQHELRSDAVLRRVSSR